MLAGMKEVFTVKKEVLMMRNKTCREFLYFICGKYNVPSLILQSLLNHRVSS